MKPTILILIYFSVSLCFGQKQLNDVSLKRTLKQDGLQFEFTVLDDEKHGVWFYSKKKVYFWYKVQGVKSTQGESSGILLHGKFESFYTDDQLHSKGVFHKGVKAGEWMNWRKDGSLISVEKWSNGELKSKKWYDEAGRVFKVQRSFGLNLEQEKADTVILQRKLWKREFIIYRDADGRLERSENWKKGVYHGKVKTYEAGKLVLTEKYVKGELIKSSDEPKEEKAVKEKTESEKEAKPEKVKTPKPKREKKVMEEAED